MNHSYCYLYDEYLSDPKGERWVSRLETELVRKGIMGLVLKTSGFRKPKSLMTEAIQKGAGTIVVVGRDAFLQECLPLLLEYPVTVGYIPYEPSHFAKKFGIAEELLLSVEAVSARFIKTLPVAALGELSFIRDLHIVEKVHTWRVDDAYTVTSEKPATSKISLALDGATPQFQLEFKPMQKRTGLFQKDSPKTTSLKAQSLSLELAEQGVVLVDGREKPLKAAQLRFSEKQLKLLVNRALATKKEI